MIEMIDTGTAGQLEMRMSGAIAAVDYDDVLTPALEAALADVDAVRLLVVVGEDLSFNASAAWADMKLGLSHWRGFDRVAVCAGSGWIASTIRAFAPIMPCPVQVFDFEEEEAARRWLRESLGAIHLRDLGGPALLIELVGKVSPEDYAMAEGDLDAKLLERDGFRLLIDVREFDGWQGLSAMGAHLSLARGHAPLLDKAAIVGDRAWQKMAQKVGSRFLDAETQFFDAANFEAAKKWLMSD
ncbi:SpoIIAA family protein [Parasedimentitalea psychrophila]|uniref:STAS/SEC14 domain-containing protein n=1 Tax=Parasedimentitalea psychrophila TaxID=2997337 RepID=A0A9Y2KVA0_9RHOB|nr:STAS/SEC14 domain-containing protein [Parasedimentitalea psychrophila]WIY23810.1 STAS/SEC14 domain-containing protein [Parasedimentitalea psychrophila]